MNNTLKSLILKPMNLLYKFNPKLELELMFYLKHGYKLNLDKPETYNEKLNWMKLYYRNDLMPICSDKYSVRKYVEDKGLKGILNDLLWVGDNAYDIPFENLPKQFVIKVTHGAGNNIICLNKNELNINKTIKQVNKWLSQKYLPAYGEWYYGIVQPRIIVEKLLSEDGSSIPIDYKLYCFNDIEGKRDVGITAVHDGRFTKSITKTIYNSDWEKQTGIVFGEKPDLKHTIEKPENYDLLVKYAKILSAPFPHARVDFFIVNNKIYFGEITFMTGAGYNKIKPRSFDELLGSWINLNVEE